VEPFIHTPPRPHGVYRDKFIFFCLSTKTSLKTPCYERDVWGGGGGGWEIFSASRSIESFAVIIAEECLQHEKPSSRRRGWTCLQWFCCQLHSPTTHHIRSSNLYWTVPLFVFATVCLGVPKPIVTAPNYNALTLLSPLPPFLYLPGYHPYCGYVTRLKKKTVISVTLHDETGSYQNWD